MQPLSKDVAILSTFYRIGSALEVQVFEELKICLLLSLPVTKTRTTLLFGLNESSVLLESKSAKSLSAFTSLLPYDSSYSGDPQKQDEPSELGNDNKLSNDESPPTKFEIRHSA